MRHSRSFKLLAGVFSLALLAAACGGDDDEGGGIETGEEGVSAGELDIVEVQEGGVVVLAGEQEPTGLNWLAAEDNAAWTANIMAANVWAQSHDVFPNGEFHANTDLNEVELVSEDPQTIEYRIDPDATWNDGTPITADDYEFTWDAQNHCDEAAELEDPNQTYNAAGCQGFDAIESVEGSDDGKTVTVTFSEPFADWVTLFNPVFPRHAFEAAGGGDTIAGFNTGFKVETLPATGLEDYVPSSGPFIVTGYEPGVSMTLEKNADYWGENQAAVDEFLVRWITEGTQQAPALQNGEVDVIFPQAQLDLVQQVQAIPTAEAFIGFGTFWEHVDLNQNNVHLAVREVRQAIAHALDRNEIVTRLPAQFDPSAEVLNNRIYFPGDGRYVDQSGDFAEQDIAAAQALLEEAGYAQGNDGVYAHPQNGRLSMRITWRDPNERRQSTAQLIQAQLTEAGIEVTFAPQPDFEFLDTGNFDLALFGWTGGTSQSSTDSIYRSTGGQNFSANVNPEIDALYDEANVELDPEARAELMNQVDELLWVDVHNIPLFQVPELLAWNAELGNVIYSGYAGPSWNVYQWGQVAN
ncbi:MAG: ABC transporter family substrate-binding protein [Acidimicrobiales bacterium]